MASIWAELKRRNVVKIAVAYAIVGWLLVEIASTVLPIFEAPQWVLQTITFVIILGFPLALVFAWAFELTPGGIKREKAAERPEPVSRQTERKLRFLIIGLLGIAVIYLAVEKFFWAEQASTLTQPVTGHSIAVLPFVDMSPEKDQEYFSDGIAEELLNQLTKLRGLHVAGRTSSFSFKGKDEDLRVIGEKLNVAHILEGSVRKAGDRVRITVQLIKVSDGYHLWSQTYDRELNDIFAIEEETAKSVATALSVTLGVGDIDFRAGGTRNFEAYDARLEAQALMLQQGTENSARAIELLEKAVSLDPDYADGWSLLATAYSAAATVWISERAEEFLDKAVQATDRAIEIAPEAVQSVRIAAGSFIRERNWVQAERTLQKALGLAPADLISNLLYGNFLLNVGRPEAAIRYARRAVELDPLSLTPSLQLAIAHQTNGDIDKTLQQLERAKGLIGNHVVLNGAVLVLAMEIDDRMLTEKYLSIIENDPATIPLGRTFTRTMGALLDSPDAAREELHRSYRDPAFDSPLSRSVIGVYAAYFGDPELTLKIFHELNDAGVLNGDQIWRPIYKEARRLPGYKDLMRKRGLEDYWRSSGSWGKFCRPLGHADFECE